MRITSQDVLIVADVQNDFCPGGALPVPGGDQIMDPIHRAAQRFEHVILIQDWHPRGHSSFASAHPGRKPFESIPMPYGEQILWPDHCVQGTPGANFHPALDLPQAELILRKGFHRAIDSYSAFFENDRKTPTGLDAYLRERNLTRVFLVGLAYDFCVAFSALDAARLNLNPTILTDACRAIDVEGSVAKMEENFRTAGVSLCNTSALWV